MEKNQLIKNREAMIEDLFSQHADPLLRMCFLYLKDMQAAEDAVQETFIKAFRYCHEFRGDSSPKTWLVRIAVNTCKNMLRSEKELLSMEHADMEGLLPSREEDQAVRLTVAGEIGKLPLKYREIILLYYYQELDAKGIADILGLPRTTVEYRLRRAKALLKPGLKEMYFDE
ncbi:sigma-70 family RNA polymerase sigma factor [Bacilliculturomica massiliensis]|uniref:sigma-70 family RNA polymerase sigma factor n=1 Tax=Bacilliculturomica massiliensis TaxID=1917867 RepID=UPI00102FA0D4|nr:sigma-70 family RNA polymerase sigma factor [Bacilliculturomica massiliensis]